MLKSVMDVDPFTLCDRNGRKKNVDIDFGCVLRFGDYNLQSKTQQVKQQWGKESMTLVVFFYFPFFSFSFVLVFFSHFIYTHKHGIRRHINIYPPVCVSSLAVCRYHRERGVYT